jgi:hypothetical protein
MAARLGDDSNEEDCLQFWEWTTMQRIIFAAAALFAVVASFATPCRADLFNYVVRTSGLGWSDGYHACDQCPPRRHHAHGHHFALPSWGASQEPHAPYYIEEPAHRAAPVEQLPSAPADVDSRAPNPQARYQPQSRYFQALQAEQQGETLQARRPVTRPPF